VWRLAWALDADERPPPSSVVGWTTRSTVVRAGGGYEMVPRVYSCCRQRGRAGFEPELDLILLSLPRKLTSTGVLVNGCFLGKYATVLQAPARVNLPHLLVVVRH